jgi:demethylmenaquinone methyltransferase/2-methoxy-6-polyprenyl-1,4-benzoquinol methylase
MAWLPYYYAGMIKSSGPTHDLDEPSPRSVQTMFTRIASHYDLMNRLMTAGQDLAWREMVIRRATLPKQGRLLDLGTGTGDLARLALRQYPGCQPVAVDFSLGMMRLGKRRPRGSRLHWAASDALQLPFPSETFAAVVSAFLLRNLSDLTRCLREQYRVLQPGGRIVTLDTTPPRHKLVSPLVRFHLHTLIPFMGRLVARDEDAYRYLGASTESFLEAGQLAHALVSVGFQEVGFQTMMLGTVAIHWGHK